MIKNKNLLKFKEITLKNDLNRVFTLSGKQILNIMEKVLNEEKSILKLVLIEYFGWNSSKMLFEVYSHVEYKQVLKEVINTQIEE